MQSAFLFSLILLLATSCWSTLANPVNANDPIFRHPRFGNPSTTPPAIHTTLCPENKDAGYFQWTGQSLSLVPGESTPDKKVFRAWFKEAKYSRTPPTKITATVFKDYTMTVLNEPDLSRLPQTPRVVLQPFADPKHPIKFTQQLGWWMDIHGKNKCTFYPALPFDNIGGFNIRAK